MGDYTAAKTGKVSPGQHCKFWALKAVVGFPVQVTTYGWRDFCLAYLPE